MARPTKEQQYLLDKSRRRASGKIKDMTPLTKEKFERLLRKAAQPLPKKESDLKEIGTSEARPFDGYSEKHRNRDKTEDTEG